MMPMFRRTDIVSAVILATVLGLACGLLIGHLVSPAFAQIASLSQDAINARVDERFIDMGRRLENVESALRWGIGALLANLGAHLAQIYGQLQRRGGR